MKIYLNGMDHVAAGLADACRFTPGGSNHFMLALVLDGVPEAARLTALPEALPPEVRRMLTGRPRRGWDLAPYWAPGGIEPVPLDETDASDVTAGLEQFGDLPLPAGQALALRLARLPENRSFLLWKFSHRIFDGLGAELLVQSVLRGRMADYAAPGMADAELRHWGDKMRAGREVNRALRTCATAPLMRYPAGPARRGRARFLLRSVALEPLRERAEREAGAMMFGCFVMGTAAHVAAEFLFRKGSGGGMLVMPVSLDLRKRGARHPELFGNQWGMLPLAWRYDAMRDAADWIRAAKLQTAAALGSGLPGAFAKANLLMRILPERAMACLSQRCFQGRAGSLMFSLLAQSEIPEEALGCRVENFFHAPTMPPDPAFGLFLNCRQDRLNLTASWRDGAVPDEEMARLLDGLCRALEA